MNSHKLVLFTFYRILRVMYEVAHATQKVQLINNSK